MLCITWWLSGVFIVTGPSRYTRLSPLCPSHSTCMLQLVPTITMFMASKIRSSIFRRSNDSKRKMPPSMEQNMDKSTLQTIDLIPSLANQEPLSSNRINNLTKWQTSQEWCQCNLANRTCSSPPLCNPNQLMTTASSNNISNGLSSRMDTRINTISRTRSSNNFCSHINRTSKISLAWPI